MAIKDSELVKAIRNGNLDTFAVLDARYRDIALQQALRIVGNSFEADDVVQEAMFRAYERIEQLADESQFGPWLRSIVRNIAIDHLRVRFRRNEHAADIEALDLAPIYNVYAADDQDSLSLDRMIAQLSPPLARVMSLRYRENLKIAEVATRLGVPIGTVKRRIYDAKRTIRRTMIVKFDSTAAWEIVNAAKSEIASLPRAIRQDVLGVAVAGDLPRNEFLPNNSGLLICSLFSNRESLNLYETQAHNAVTEIFDKLCRPFQGCAESPVVWENLATDELYLPTTVERFTPPRIPQPHWYSMYLFDLIDHHHMIYGEDFIAPLYRPDPKSFTLRMAAEVMRLLQSGKAARRPMVGFGTVVHWQALKMVRILQLHFSPGKPTIARDRALDNYDAHVPEFSTKKFGRELFVKDTKLQYPVDRTEHSESHADACRKFITDCCALLTQHQHDKKL